MCGHGANVVELRIIGRGNEGSKPPAAILKLEQFLSPHIAVNSCRFFLSGVCVKDPTRVDVLPAMDSICHEPLPKHP